MRRYASLEAIDYLSRALSLLGTFPEGTVRVSPGAFNTEADIDHLCHCCVGTCSAPAGGGPATSCACGGCGSTCFDKCTMPTSTCVNAPGGKPCD